MTPAMRREYGLEASPDRRTTLTQALGFRSETQPKRAEADPVQAAPGASNTSPVAKCSSSRALDRKRSWGSMPVCTYSEPNHNRLPELLRNLLKRCEEGSHSDGSSLCPVPGFFKLRWTELECFYCEVHGCFVFGEHARSHISRKHSGAWNGITRDKVLDGFLGHIKRCYPAVVSQLTKDVKKRLPDRLQAPLPFALIQQRYMCSVPGCKTWYLETGNATPNSELIRHLRKCHKLSGAEYASAASIDPEWTQKIKFGEINKAGSDAVFIVPHHPVSNTPAFPLRPPTLAGRPGESSWTITLGWDVELTRISRVLDVPEKSAIATLRDLVDLPSRHRISGAKTDTFRLVEKGLWVLNKLSLRYFSDVISWIAEKHYSFRLLFRFVPYALYVNPLMTAAFSEYSFHLPDSDHELYRIRRLHCAMETMVIRDLSKRILKKDKPKFLLSSESVDMAGYAIIQCFIKANGDPDHEELLTLKHNLFVSLLKGGQRTASKVGEICEQALLALSLLPSGEWKKAVCVRTHVCCGLWAFRGTFANWSRMQSSRYHSPSTLRLQKGTLDKGSHHLHHAFPNESPGDAVPEDPQDDEDDEDDSDNELDEAFVQIFESIRLESRAKGRLLQKLSSVLDAHFDASEDDSSLPVEFDEYVSNLIE